MANPVIVDPELGKKNQIIDLLSSLNAASAVIQESIHTEQDVFEVIREQIVELGFRGGLALLDESKEYLTFRMLSYPPRFQKVIRKFEGIAGMKSEDHTVLISDVDEYQQVIEDRKALFVADSREILLQIIPKSTPFVTRAIRNVFGNVPAIYAPMITHGQVIGMLTFAGNGLRKSNIPAIVAFSNHIAVALENASLFAQQAENEQKFQSLFKNVPTGLFRSTPDGQIIDANPALANILGYQEKSALLKVNAETFYVDPDVRKRMRVTIQEKGGVKGFETRFARKDGVLIWVELSITPVLDDEGRIIFFEGVITDITEQKEAQISLQRQTQDLRLVNEIGQAINRGVDLESIVKLIGDGIKDLFSFVGLVVLLVDKHEPCLEMKYLDLPRPALQKFMAITNIEISRIRTPLEPGNPYVQAVVERKLLSFQGNDEITAYWSGLITHLPLSVSIQDRLIEITPWLLKNLGIQAIVSVPLLYEGDPLGLLNVVSNREVTESDLSRLQIIFDQLTIAIKHKLEEDAREESENRYRQVSELVSDFAYAFRVEPNGELVREWVTDALVRMSGWTAGELHERGGWETLIHPEDMQIPMGQYQVLMQGKLDIVEYRILTKDEEARWVRDYARPIWDEEQERVTHIYGAVQDITQRKQAEHQTLERQHYLEGLLSSAPDAILTLDPQNKIVDWNPGAEQMFGYSKQEVVGRNLDPLIARGVKLEQAVDFTKIITGGELIKPTETVRFRQDGSSIDVILAGAPIVLDDELVGLVAVYTDISERKQAEQEILRSANRTEALLEIEQVITSTLDLKEVLDIIMTELAKVIPYDSVSLQILRDESLEIIACQGFGQPDEIVGMVFPLDPKFPNQKVIKTKKALTSEDISRDYPHFEENSETYDSGHIRSWLGVPLISKGTLVGMIAVDRSEVAPFSKSEIQMATAIASQAALAIDNARLFSEAKQRLERLSSLRDIDQAITSNLELQPTLDILLEHVLHQLVIDAAVILLFHPKKQRLEYVAGQGFRTKALQFTNLGLGEGFAGMAALERRIVHLSDLSRLNTGFLRSPEFRDEGFVAYIGIPLIAKKDLIGVLEIYHRQPLDPEPEWMAFFETLAGQAAIAIDNINLFQNLQKSNVDLVKAYDATIEGWALALEIRDMETEGHSRRVVEMTLNLARKLGVGEEDLVHFRRGAQLHDIGKMGIPDAILQKPGKLNDTEWEIMRQHPVYAYKWLSQIAYLKPALDIPYCHHEKWDGSGYPLGLIGEQIPLAARIFTVVDVWDALRSDRPYRKAWPEEKVKDFLKFGKDSHFDPLVVDAFLDLLDQG